LNSPDFRPYSKINIKMRMAGIRANDYVTSILGYERWVVPFRPFEYNFEMCEG